MHDKRRGGKLHDLRDLIDQAGAVAAEMASLAQLLAEALLDHDVPEDVAYDVVRSAMGDALEAHFYLARLTRGLRELVLRD